MKFWVKNLEQKQLGQFSNLNQHKWKTLGFFSWRYTKDTSYKKFKRVNEQNITDTESKKLKKKRSADEAKTEIVNTIIEQIKEISEDLIENKDSTDGLEDTIKEIFQQYWMNWKI